MHWLNTSELFTPMHPMSEPTSRNDRIEAENLIGPAACYQQTTSPDHQGELAPMAAATTVSQFISADNFERQPVTRNPPFRAGVLTLFGYGISVYVNRGHLIVSDGIAKDRRTWRFPRVGHGLKRLVVISSDGDISLAALRWLADMDASFCMLDRLGRVLVTSGPVSSS